jgi:plasmid replication initiation protein
MSSKTTDAIKSYTRNPDAIVEAGEVVDMRFQTGASLSLRAAKMFHLLVQAAGVDVTEDKQHRLTFASLNDVFHLSVEDLEALIDELHSTTLKLKLTDTNGRNYTKSGPILSDFEREDETQQQAEIRFDFSKAFRMAIRDSSHWAVISRKAVMAFEGKYSLRLYTILSLRSGLRKASEDFMLDDFRLILGVPENAYPRWNNFRQFVLTPAMKEVNQLAGLIVGYTPLRNGRKVVGLRLTWSVKDQNDRLVALKELEASRVGRKARREGQVELIAQTEKIERQEIALALSTIRD